MDGVVVDISEVSCSDCKYCRILNRLNNRRFYSDDDSEPFIIIENLTTLTPILVFCEHAVATCIEEIMNVYNAMNAVCSAVLNDRYYLRPDDSLGHFSILSFRIFT